MSERGVVTRMKTFFSALLVLTLASIVVVPLISEVGSSEGSAQEIGIYVALLLAWVLLVVTFAILYLGSERGRRFKPIPLHRSRIR